jgi:hypothetical protein
MIFAKSASLFLVFVLCIFVPQVRAQIQTPTKVALVSWTDPVTGLTWTKQDNGSDVNWNQAIAYCANLRLGGYTDWRLPTIDELQDIYDANANVDGYHVKGNLKLSEYWQWSSSSGNASGEAWRFTFSHGGRISGPLGFSGGKRALCVRR